MIDKASPKNKLENIILLLLVCETIKRDIVLTKLGVGLRVSRRNLEETKRSRWDDDKMSFKS